LWIEPETLADLLSLLNLCKQRNVPHMIFGRGSNLLVRDGGIRGAVISLGQACMQLRKIPNGVAAGAGASLFALVKFALHHGFEGLEFCVGIPGSVGGALATNAGAWGSSISERLHAALLFDSVRMERKRLEKTDVDFGYRRSNIISFGIILEAEFSLKPGEPAKISEKMDQYIARRSKIQPLRSRSAGSIFKNPPGGFAGAIIEQLGFKGYRRGDAAVSELHANFIVNEKDARAAEVLAIIDEIKKRAEKDLGIQLEEEIKIVGED
jgi:UDP-N-acetylmuramate dehydrogenase